QGVGAGPAQRIGRACGPLTPYGGQSVRAQKPPIPPTHLRGVGPPSTRSGSRRVEGTTRPRPVGSGHTLPLPKQGGLPLVGSWGHVGSLTLCSNQRDSAQFAPPAHRGWPSVTDCGHSLPLPRLNRGTACPLYRI